MDQKRIFSTYTGWLIGINVVVFLAYLIFQNFIPNLINYLAISPAGIINDFKVWTFITSMFMHSPVSLTHLIFNMITLMFLGSFVERLIGKKRFIWLYMVGGLIASLFFVLLAYFLGNSDIGMRLFGTSTTLAVGASGAIFALGGLLAILTPKMKVLVMFIIPMPIWMAMIGLVFVLWTLSLGLPLGIGNSAHFGGLMTGIVYGLYLKKKYPNKTKMISRYFAR